MGERGWGGDGGRVGERGWVGDVAYIHYYLCIAVHC